MIFMKLEGKAFRGQAFGVSAAFVVDGTWVIFDGKFLQAHKRRGELFGFVSFLLRIARKGRVTPPVCIFYIRVPVGSQCVM